MAKDTWFRLPEVVEWRRRLIRSYTESTIRYLKAREPELIGKGDISRLPKAAKKAALDVVVRSGRAGLRLNAGEEPLTTYARKRQSKVRHERSQFSKALTSLLERKSFRAITVMDVLRVSQKSRFAFYSVFRSGLHGAFCYWASKELDELASMTHQLFAGATQQGVTPVTILRQWVETVSQFIMARPYGRLQLVNFLVYEIDSVGSALVSRLEELEIGSADRKHQDEIIEEFAELAADFHRSAARIIHELESFFMDPRFNLASRSKAARELWTDRESAAWGMAVSFWKTLFTSFSAIGMIEAEWDVKIHRTLVVDAWYRSVVGLRNPRISAKPRAPNNIRE